MNKWKVDPTESTVEFSVPHMMVSKVTGTFGSFSGELQGNIADLTKCKIHFQVDVQSIHTQNKERDVHLCSADFFDAQTYPHMTFTSQSIYADNDGKYRMMGELTIKQTMKRVLFCITPVEVNVFGACYVAEGEINRKEFGLTWNRAIEAGGVMVGENIDIQMTIAVIKAT
ncbi:polyisoprenoid-binding protein [Sporosarcina sp. PTS2304]|uniref:YceI family protein n=1 Tax=Sporosarcina sp. PTS2304 TaxID=2283194 RepID=UPI000E0CE0A0|nr:YceI family protein [Sporosarcina sp. PTS2304]AXI00325.1 polyisoprenoid-binding protein [Sporosarcina sp. PTS2304]